MYLVYTPDGGDEQRWSYNPRKLKATEREMLERKTERNFSQFTADALQGNSLCRRALLFLFLRREHPRIRWDDVDFTWDELRLEYSRQELQQLREKVEETMNGSERDAALAKLDEEIDSAYDGGDEAGKAQLPIAE